MILPPGELYQPGLGSSSTAATGYKRGNRYPMRSVHARTGSAHSLKLRQWKLQKVGLAGVLDWDAFIAAGSTAGARVGLNPSLFSHCERWSAIRNDLDRVSATCRAVEDRLASKDIKVIKVANDLIDQIWDDQPALPATPIFQHPLKFAGEAAEAKLAKLRKFVNEAYLLSDLSEIAWLYAAHCDPLLC
jgi:hypothetical protein